MLFIRNKVRNTSSKLLLGFIIWSQVSCSSKQQNIVYRDLNKNGEMDLYEDKNQPIESRIDDLLSQMTLEEKAGTMFIQGTLINEDGSIEKKEDQLGLATTLPSSVENIRERKINHFNGLKLGFSSAYGIILLGFEMITSR